MKIITKANELSGLNVEKVSLVQHAANRRPFAILKSEPLPQDQGTMDLVSKVTKMFKKEEPAAKVVGVVVSKSAARKAFPILKEAGFTVTPECAVALTGDVVMLKQEGFVGDPATHEGDVIALSEDVGVVMDRVGVAKEFCDWRASSDFSTTLASQSFFPSLRMATEALSSTVWHISYDANSPEEMRTGLEAALQGFSKFVLGLTNVLPVEVFKAAQKLADGFEGSTVHPIESVSKSEGGPMKTPAALREAVAGDLAELFKAEDEAAASKAAAEAKAAEEAAATAAAEAAAVETASADAAALAAAAEGDASGTTATAEAAAAVEATKTAAPLDAAALIDAVKGILGPMVETQKAQGEQLSALVNQLTAVTTTNTALNNRLAEVEKTAAAAVAKADNTVVMHDFSVDVGTLHSLSNAPGRVTKAHGAGEQKDVWKGLFPALDAMQDAAANRG